MRPPRAMPTPLKAYHRPITVGCCLRVNHIAVMDTAPISLPSMWARLEVDYSRPDNGLLDSPKHGSATASNMPETNRNAIISP